MTRNNKEMYKLIIRYLLIILIGLNTNIFYFLFKNPANLIVCNILNLFYPASIQGSIIVFKNISIDLIPPCFAPSAFFLLFILIFSTRNINFIRRIMLFILSSLTLFIINIIRIVYLVLIFDSPYFNSAHFILWNILSVLFVVLLWFFYAGLFKIKEIPIYSDWIYAKNFRTRFSH